MAASDNLHPDQLKMFMTPQEIMGYVTTSADRKTLINYRTPHASPTVLESMNKLWKRKLKESKKPRDKVHGGGVYDALKEGKNILAPSGEDVEIYHRGGGRFITDKHHRIAAQADIDKKLGTETFVPVSHVDKEFPPHMLKEPKRQGPPKPQTASEREQADAIIKHFE